ncbi:MAG: CheR family methyltransferase [Gammaproteobacteria bacterium]|jgi:chemotaxis protein methyltransferase CheR
MSSIALEEGGAYQSLQMLLQDEFGVVIGEERKNSITAKLKPVMVAFNFDSLDALVDALRTQESGAIKNSILQAITAYEAEWFDPPALFNLLDEYLLPNMLDSSRTDYRIWVVGSGDGQLPYSLAMKIHQAMKQAGSSLNVKIEATDISDAIISKASEGLFEEASMHGMLEPYQKKYMTEHSGEWQVNDDIRSMVGFSTCNLLEDFEDKGYFDLVICLDVLVYYSVPVKTRLLNAFAALLDPSGILIAGMNEPVLPFNDNFEMVRHDAGIFYRQKAY